MRYFFITSYGYKGMLNIPYGTILHNYFFCDDCTSKAEVIKRHSNSKEKVIKVFTSKAFDINGDSKFNGNILKYKQR